MQLNRKSGAPGRTFEPFYVVAFDPGGTTGWASALCEYEPQSMRDIHLETGEFIGLHHELLYDFMTDRLIKSLPPEFVTEPFTHRQYADAKRSSVELISVEYIGVMKLFCQEHDIRLYEGFTPGDAKDYVPNMKLEKLGWLQTPQHPKRHQNDALRQLVKYLIVKKHMRHPITSLWKD